MDPSDFKNDRSNANTDSEGFCGGAEPSPPRRRRVWGYRVAIVLLLGACGLLAFKWRAVDRKADNYRREIASIRDNTSAEISDLKAVNDSLARFCQSLRESEAEFRRKVAAAYPMIITGIKFEAIDEAGNVEIPAGSTLYSSGVKYIRPVIEYTGLVSEKKTFNVRFIKPDETLRKGQSSPAYYTYSSGYDIEYGEGHRLEMSGWGNNSGNGWPPGDYRVEIWCEGKCCIARKFSVFK